MPRKVTVFTTAGFTQGSGSEREQACRYVEAAGHYGADLVCLPENFYAEGGPEDAECALGPMFERLAEGARTHQLWIVAGYCVRDNELAPTVQNCAVVIDRNGRLAGTYAKVHPTIGECERNIVPGQEATVIETDFGRLGLAICYDIGWPEHWANLAKGGAELVVWPSAYDGGYPLQHYASLHAYFVVSSVRSDHAKIVDVTGHVITSTSDWHPFTATTIDLEKELFHADENEHQLLRLESELAGRVRVDALGEERIFTLESDDEEWPVSRIKAHYGLESLPDYLKRAQAIQDRYRGRQVGEMESILQAR